MIFKVLWEFLTSPHHLIRAHNLSPRNPNNSIAIRPVSRRDTHSIPATHYTGENTCAICIHTSNYRAPVRPRTKPCSLLFCSCLSSTISHLQGILSGCMGIREEERERERERIRKGEERRRTGMPAKTLFPKNRARFVSGTVWSASIREQMLGAHECRWIIDS